MRELGYEPGDLVLVKIGDTVTFKAAAKGTIGTVTYTWQYSADGGITWKNATKGIGAGYNTALMKATINSTHYALLYRYGTRQGRANRL